MRQYDALEASYLVGCKICHNDSKEVKLCFYAASCACWTNWEFVLPPYSGNPIESVVLPCLNAAAAESADLTVPP